MMEFWKALMVAWRPSHKGFEAELTLTDDCLVLEVEAYYLDVARTNGPYYLASAFCSYSTERFSTPEEAKKCAENMAREMLSEAIDNLGILARNSMRECEA